MITPESLEQAKLTVDLLGYAGMAALCGIVIATALGVIAVVIATAVKHVAKVVREP